MAYSNYIGKLSKGFCSANWSKQLAIGQDHLDTLGHSAQFHTHFTSYSPPNACWLVIGLHFEVPYLMPIQSGTCQNDRSIFVGKIKLHNMIPLQHQRITNVMAIGIERRNTTLAVFITPTGNNSAITSQEHRMTTPCGHLDVWNSFIQGWNATSPKNLASKSYSLAITSEKHSMLTACRHLGIKKPFI